MAIALRERLENAGFRVVLTRWDDSTVSLDERVKIANQELGARLPLPAYRGGTPARRYRLDLVSRIDPSPATVRLSRALNASLAAAMPEADIREKQAPFKVLSDTRIGALMFDTPMPDPADRDASLARIADALADGFTAWAESPPAPAKAAQLVDDEISITADEVDYDPVHKLVIGKGSVKIALREIELRGDGLEYDTNTGLMRFSAGEFTITGGQTEGTTGKGATIEFDQEAQLLKLVDHYQLQLGRRLINGSTDTSSATLDLKTGKCQTDGLSRTELMPIERAGEAGEDVLDRRRGLQQVPGEQAGGSADPGLGNWVNPLVQPALDPGLEIPLADGFDYPVGAPDGEGYYVARAALTGGRGHLGEDWNGKGGGNSDEGDPVYSIGNGRVIFARDVRVGHGKVVIIRHVYLDENGVETPIESVYVHLGEIEVAVGEAVERGQVIGTIGTNRGMYLAHLHLEVRKRLNVGMMRSKFPNDETTYHRPSDFINAHRPGWRGRGR